MGDKVQHGMAMPGTSFTLCFALALALACFAVANGTDEQATPDSDTPLAPTGKDENRQLRTELDQMHITMKATEERHGKEIAKLKTLINANVQSEPRAANADSNARLLQDAKGSKHRRRSKHRQNGITNVLSTPVMLASCEKSWPFQIKATAPAQTIHACVKCKPDAPLPWVIAKHGKQLIWACDANKFKETGFCEKSLSWLHNQTMSETGESAKLTCGRLRELIRLNDQALEAYSKHSQDLKLSTTAKLTSESLYSRFVKSWVLKPKSDYSLDLARTTVRVEKTVHVAYKWSTLSQVFTVLSHIVRACGYIAEQPLQCLDAKRSQCVWSYVHSNAGKFKSGQKLPGKVHNWKKYQDQPCGPNSLLALSTSRKL